MRRCSKRTARCRKCSSGARCRPWAIEKGVRPLFRGADCLTGTIARRKVRRFHILCNVAVLFDPEVTTVVSERASREGHSMRRRVIRNGLLVLLLAAIAAPALAQRTTGEIVGTVTDESGAVLPGVTITIRGSGVPGAPTVVSSETGAYRFPALPPGDYTLEFTLQGFGTLRRENIPVGVGAVVELKALLKVSTLSETVTVTGESPVVNLASTTVSTNYNQEWVASAPIRHFSFFDLVNSAPGVSATSTVGSSTSATTLGSTTNDNVYAIDGTDLSAPTGGTAWPWPNADAIQEIEVLQLGASAEYGNVMGAVFNVVTRQGSNAFHGDATYYGQGQSLTSRNTTAAQE